MPGILATAGRAASVLLVAGGLGGCLLVSAKREPCAERMTASETAVSREPVEDAATQSAPVVPRVEGAAEPVAGEEVAARPSQPLKHAAVGATVTASSTHIEQPGEGPVSNLVDGRLDTRWSSDYTEPQEVLVDLGAPVAIDRLRLHWEKAFATRYTVWVSGDSKNWTKAQACLKSKSATKPGTDTINLNGLVARFIKLELQKRVSTDWGFSLYEIEVNTK